MAQARPSPVHRDGLPFSIKNILNLPEDPDESTKPRGKVPYEQILTSFVVPSTSEDSSRSGINSSPCRKSWTANFTSRVHPCVVFKGGAGMAQGFPSGDDNTRFVFRRRGLTKRKRRSLFTLAQVQKMEKEFDSRKYLSERRRAELAEEIELSETQVKTWFQNRRTKWRKELGNENPPRKVPDGRLRSCLAARKAEYD